MSDASAAQPDARFTPEELESALNEICRSLGVSANGARLLRLSNNAVYSLADAPVVVRILVSRGLRHRPAKVAAAARYFADFDIPAVRLLPGVDQPFAVAGHVATIWESVPTSGPKPTTADLADILRQIHALPPTEKLPEWKPLHDVRARLDDAEALDDADRQFLIDRVNETEENLAELEFALPTSVVHGDAHVRNLIVGPHGPVICDFDSTCVGPPEWDLTPIALATQRFGDPPDRYRLLAETYGFDVTAWSGYSVLRDIRDLKLVTSALPILRSQPTIRPQFERRFTDFKAGRVNTRWTRY